MQNPVELNRYVYAANNPVNFSDPSGLFLIDYAINTAKRTVPATGGLTILGSTVVEWLTIAIPALSLVAGGVQTISSANARTTEGNPNKAVPSNISVNVDITDVAFPNGPQCPDGIKYSNGVLQELYYVLRDKYHNFPLSFDAKILTQGAVAIIKDNGLGFALRGTINGVEVVFNLVIRNCIVSHRDAVKVEQWNKRSASQKWQWNLDLNDIPGGL